MYLNIDEVFDMYEMEDLEPLHRMYLNSLTLNPKETPSILEPLHRMYLNQIEINGK